MKDAALPLWHGRLRGGAAPETMALSRSLDVDARLWRDDIAGSRAHIRMLWETGLLSIAEVDAIAAALDIVEEEFAAGLFVPEDVDPDSIEDIHTAIEHRVTTIAGAAGAKIHTGRSRNDQVATALRLWCRREQRIVARVILDLATTLAERADEADARSPRLAVAAYTHLQRAQPVLLSHHLRAHAWALLRDVSRLIDALERMDVSPLGAGAVGGSSLPLDPGRTAELLGFARTFDNSIDAVSDRDFVAEFLFALAMAGVHLSRIGEEIVLWTSAEFGFMILDDAHATGSSMLPQKKNADIAELTRGKAGRLVGNLTGLLVTLKGLPLSYNRDLQEDKEPIFDSTDTVLLVARALAGLLRSATFVESKLEESARAEEMGAVDLAEDLVTRGMPFRAAHAVVGDLVARSLDSGRSLGELLVESEHFGPQYSDFLALPRTLERRRSPGGGGASAAEPQHDALAVSIAALRASPALAD